MNANQEIIAELRRVLNERDSFQRQLGTLQNAILTALVHRIEPRLSRHPVTVVQHAGSIIARIGEAMACQFEDGDDLLEAVKELVRERDEARAEVKRLQGDVWSLTTTLRNLPVPSPSLMDACTEAYKRGAEDMREACQQWCRAWENNGEAIADALADLRVEDKP